jgi:hypothetical protein
VIPAGKLCQKITPVAADGLFQRRDGHHSLPVASLGDSPAKIGHVQPDLIGQIELEGFPAD